MKCMRARGYANYSTLRACVVCLLRARAFSAFVANVCTEGITFERGRQVRSRLSAEENLGDSGRLMALTFVRI